MSKCLGRLGVSTLLVMLLFCFAAADPGEVTYPPDVIVALEDAGDHRAELETVLSHYASGDDSLKLQAAFYLIANMEGHSCVTYSLRDTADAEISFNVLDYPDYATLKTALDTLEAERGELDFERKDIVYDLDTIAADFLINQIDFAFLAWREKPWAKRLSFDDFCRYVLPYRGSNEPLESFRAMFRDKYEDIEARMSDPTDPLEAATLINDDIKSWFSFDPRYYCHPSDQGLSEMLENRMGRCGVYFKRCGN